MSLARLLLVVGIGASVWLAANGDLALPSGRPQQVRPANQVQQVRPVQQASSRGVIVGVLREAAGSGANNYEIVTARGQQIPVHTRQGARFLNREVKLTVEYISGGPRFRIIRLESNGSRSPGDVTPERQNPVVLVRASEGRINERVRSTRQQIEDKRRLARRLEDRLERLPRVDPDVRLDHIEEIRDVRRGALAEISRELRELPRQVAGWERELDGIVLAGNAEAVEIDARARANLDWIENRGLSVLKEMHRRFERMELP